MARKQEVIITLVDDIDGSAAAETVTFSIDGAAYEIDLNKKNAKSIRTDFEKWSAPARKAKPKSRASRRRATTPKPTSEAAAIRSWAGAHGVDVPARGRIPRSVVELFKAS